MNLCKDLSNFSDVETPVGLVLSGDFGSTTGLRASYACGTTLQGYRLSIVSRGT